jgi:hypothetical protein
VVEVGQVEHLQVRPRRPSSPNAPSRSTTSAGVPATPLARRSSTLRPTAAARRASSASSRPQHSTCATDSTRSAPGRRAGLPHAPELRARVGERGERQVELVGVRRREPGRPLRPSSADDDRRVRPLHRLGQRGLSTSA